MIVALSGISSCSGDQSSSENQTNSTLIKPLRADTDIRSSAASAKVNIALKEKEMKKEKAALDSVKAASYLIRCYGVPAKRNN